MSPLANVDSMLDPQSLTASPAGPSLGHVWAERFRQSLATADLNSALDAYTDAPSWEDRWFCLEHASRSGVDPELLDSWCDGWPEHVLPFLTRGAVHARAGATSSAVDLSRASELDPTNPIPWGQLIVVSRVVGRPAADVEHFLSEMMSRTALYEPHVDYLLMLSANHGGTTEAMLAFAREVCLVVPTGSPLRALLAIAALDAMLSDEPKDHQAYLRENGLFDEVLMAAGQSVFHESFEVQPLVPALKALNAFAVVLSVLGQDDLALMLVNRIGNTFTDWPLSLLGPPTIETWDELRLRLTDKAPQMTR